MKKLAVGDTNVKHRPTFVGRFVPRALPSFGEELYDAFEVTLQEVYNPSLGQNQTVYHGDMTKINTAPTEFYYIGLEVSQFISDAVYKTLWHQ